MATRRMVTRWHDHRILHEEFPRIPLASTLDDFRAFVKAGEKLAALHLHYDDPDAVKPYALKEIGNADGASTNERAAAAAAAGKRKNYRVTAKMKLSKEKDTLAVNEHLTLAGIPEAVQRYRLGNRSALEWVVDQYRVETDDAGIVTSDCNAWGDELTPPDPHYVVRLIKQVVAVSLETMKIVDGLPKDFGGPPRTTPADGSADGLPNQAAEVHKPATPAVKSSWQLKSDDDPKQRRLR